MSTNKDRQLFKEILDSTIIPSGLNDYEKQERYRAWSDFLSHFTPTKLYRYRSVNTRNIEAFFYDQIWVTSGAKMNDAFDSRLYFDQQAVALSIKDHFSDEKIIDLIETELHENNSVMERILEYAQRMDYHENSSSEKATPFFSEIKSLRDGLLSKTNDFLQEAVNMIQGGFKFGCFSEDISSPIMWGQYADSEKGFALQYDFSIVHNNLKEGNDIAINIYPVIYINDKFCVSADFIEYMFRLRAISLLAVDLEHVTCPDESMITKILLHKSSEWKHEKEWRVLCNNDQLERGQEEYSFFVKKPTAVYLGRRMASADRQLLTDIAKQKELPVYEMTIKEDLPKYRLYSRRVIS